MLTRRFMSAVALLGAAAQVGTAQGRIMGTVRDSLGAPIAGAEVRLENGGRPITSPRSGEFRFENVKPGTVVLVVRRVGYSPYRETLIVYDGDNKVGNIVLNRLPAELDTVAIREQELFRMYPLLREFEDNRKIGLGQFVTRAQLDRLQGGFVQHAFSDMRGLILVRSDQGNKTWIANRGMRSGYRTILEDYMPGMGLQTNLPFRESISPRGADTTYCFPQIYLDNTRLSSDGTAPNIGRFSPDQLQAIEVYMGAADTPPRYIGAHSACGVIVLHTRVPDLRRRVATFRDPNQPTRSRALVSVSLAAGRPGTGCPDCGRGAAKDVSAGLTLHDRWVVGGRYATWGSSDGGNQEMRMRQAILEWYPNPEPGRVKWLLNAGLGLTTLSLSTTHVGVDLVDRSDSVTAKNLATITVGTGVDIAIVRRIVLTPFLSHTRTLNGMTYNRFCNIHVADDGSTFKGCVDEPAKPRVFNLTQIGTRIGWR